MDFPSPSESFFKFIEDNISADTNALRLKMHGKVLDFDLDFAITQIECRRKSRKKLMAFPTDVPLLFPTTLSCEQASHSSVAAFHASLLPGKDSVLDMTAGLGIDAMSFAKEASHVTACEMQPLKAEVLKWNALALGLDNLTVVCADSLEYIHEHDYRFNLIFSDPARRASDLSRVYNLHDCQPDITSSLDYILSKCDTLLVKASPLLDITQTLADIPQCVAIRTVSVAGECKEVLVEASEKGTLKLMEAIDLNGDGSINYRFSFNPNQQFPQPQFASISDISTGLYLYEPGAAVMKLAPWNALASRFGDLVKMGTSSHLFISKQCFPDFPGRVLRITDIVDKKSRKALKGSPTNVVVRNYPMQADELRKKLGVKEGDDQFIYATRVGDSPILIKAVRIRT